MDQHMLLYVEFNIECVFNVTWPYMSRFRSETSCFILSVCGQWMPCSGETVRMRSIACAFACRTNLSVPWQMRDGLVLLILDILHPVQFCNFFVVCWFLDKIIFQKYYHVITVNLIRSRSGPTLRRAWSGSKLFTNRERLSASRYEKS